jgi:basic amino acid/polyamine antiporter, APA family
MYTGGAMTSGGLARVLKLPDLVYIVLGTVIGSGVFLVPGPVLRDVGGNVSIALGVWVGGGVLSFLGALTYAELGAMMPQAGGVYVYIRDAFGRLPAFLFGWMLFTVIAPASVATLAVGSMAYLRELVALSDNGARAIALGMIVLLAILNIRGTRESAHVQDWATALKIAAIVIMSVGLLVVSAGTHVAPTAVAAPIPGAPGLLSGIGIATVAVLWAYEGWTYVTFSAGETVDPQRTFPRGIAIGTGLLIALYLMANIGYLAMLGPAAVAHSDRVASEAVRAAFGPTAGRIIALVVLISMFSAVNAILLTAPRVFYAMARDGLFFSKLAEVHPRLGTPAIAIGATAAWSMVLAASGTYVELLTYVVFTAWIFYGLGATTVFVFRRTRKDAPRPFRVPGYPVTPALFVLAACGIVVSTLVGQPKQALYGLSALVIGLPAYLIWRSRSPLPAEP